MSLSKWQQLTGSSMAEKAKRRKKDSVTEEDASKLLQRYSMNTVLGLLQEVEEAAGEKIDWRQLVKKTKTGISGAREYQMLWRHLAYGETLIDQIDPDADPLDDGSDLEYEVEAFPPISREASAEATACVKVLIGSGYPHDSSAANNSTIEAPLTINIPNRKTMSASSDGSILANEIQGTNISIPVLLQKQPQPSGIGGERRPNDGAPVVNLPSRKRKKNWSAEDDVKLSNSVQKHGDRNWAAIVKWDFKDRRPQELSQRWGCLKKKQAPQKVVTTLQPSESLAAAHRAMSMALEMGNNLRAPSQISTAGMKPQLLSQKASEPSASHQLGRAGPPKPQLLADRPSVNPAPTPDSMVKAAAVAAGARIATPADASSLIEAARSQNVVHITTGTSPVMKSSSSIGNQLPSNVHFIRNGLAKAPISTYSAPKPNISQPVEAKQSQNRSLKPAASVVPNLVGTAQVLKVMPEKENAVATTLANGIKVHQSNQAAKPAESSVCAPVERAPEDRSAALDNQSEEVGKNQPSSSSNAVKENTLEDQASISIPEPISQTTDDGVALPCSKVEDSGKSNTDNQIIGEETLEIPSSNGRHEDLPSTSKVEPAT
ncbi:hypothetical protein ACS0TY_011984 [Phlomoides rotata]